MGLLRGLHQGQRDTDWQNCTGDSTGTWIVLLSACSLKRDMKKNKQEAMFTATSVLSAVDVQPTVQRWGAQFTCSFLTEIACVCGDRRFLVRWAGRCCGINAPEMKCLVFIEPTGSYSAPNTAADFYSRTTLQPDVTLTEKSIKFKGWFLYNNTAVDVTEIVVRNLQPFKTFLWLLGSFYGS